MKKSTIKNVIIKTYKAIGAAFILMGIGLIFGIEGLDISESIMPVFRNGILGVASVALGIAILCDAYKYTGEYDELMSEEDDLNEIYLEDLNIE